MNSFVQKDQKVLYKSLAVLGLLVVMLVIPHYTGIWDNPFAIPLLILFWLGVAYIVLPEFFKKHRVAILSVYGLVIAYNFYLFSMTTDLPENHRLNLTNFMIFLIILDLIAEFVKRDIFKTG